MINHLKIQQHIEDEYEAQQLNNFYNQEEDSLKEKREKLEKIRNDYKQKQLILQLNIKEKIICNS